MLTVTSSFHDYFFCRVCPTCSFWQVEWRCSTRFGTEKPNLGYPLASLPGRVAATAAFAVSVFSDISAIPVITVALENEVFEGGELLWLVSHCLALIPPLFKTGFSSHGSFLSLSLNFRPDECSMLRNLASRLSSLASSYPRLLRASARHLGVFIIFVSSPYASFFDFCSDRLMWPYRPFLLIRTHHAERAAFSHT